MGACPAAERRGAAGCVDQGDEHAKHDKEDEDAGVIGDGGHESLADNGIERGHGIESCDEQCAHDDADEQRYVHFFGDERQDDGDDCRSESPG